MQAEAEAAREFMVEAAAEATEELMEAYLEEGELSEAQIIEGLRAGTLSNDIVPCVCGTAFKNKGVQTLLDKITELMPSPVDVPSIKGINEDESEGVRNSSDDEPFAALAFKIATDPYVGTLTFFRVYSGVLKSGDTVLQSGQRKERTCRAYTADALQHP